MALSSVSAVEKICDKRKSTERHTDKRNNPPQHKLSYSGHGLPSQSPYKINLNWQGKIDLAIEVGKTWCSAVCTDILDYPVY